MAERLSPRMERGFTLIEVLLVVLLIGILAAIALPSLLGQGAKAHDADAKSNATNIRLHVENCATDEDKTYLDCATAAQIQASGVQLGRRDLPPVNQLAGHRPGHSGGPQNGAECVQQSNGQRACEQTTPPPPIGGGGTTTTTTTETTATSTTDTSTTTTTETATTTETGTGENTVPVETGGSAPDVGDCVEGGDVEPGCVGIVASSSGYTITAVSRSSHVFRIIMASGQVTRECEPSGKGGCPGSGRW